MSERLEWKTTEELKALCRQKGLDTSGRKADLIRRLSVHPFVERRQSETATATHRVYQCESLDPHNPEPHTFIEVEKDSFLEIKFRQAAHLTDEEKIELSEGVRRLLDREKKTGVFDIRMTLSYIKRTTQGRELRFIGTF